MKVMYRANGDVRDLSDEGGRALVYAGIADEVKEPAKEPKPAKKSDKPTKVEPMTTEDMPMPPKKAA